MTILGIDPGSSRAGFGIVKIAGTNLSYIKSGILKVTAKSKNDKIEEIERALIEIIDNYSPDVVAMEKLFFSKNIKTAMEVAECRGVLTLSIVKRKIPLLEFTPQEIKQSITGHGGADKKTVAFMVSKILKIPMVKGYDDESDALATAITGGYHYRMQELIKK